MNQIGATALLVPSARRGAAQSCFAAWGASCTSGGNCAAAATIANPSMLKASSIHMLHLPPGIRCDDRFAGSRTRVNPTSSHSRAHHWQAELTDDPCYVSPGDNQNTLPQDRSAIPETSKNHQQIPTTEAETRRTRTRARADTRTPGRG